MPHKKAKRSGPEQLGSILNKLWAKIEKQKEENAEISKILEGLVLVLGKKITAHVKPYKIYKKKLTIIVTAPVYLQELLFKKEKIIDTVNQTLGKEKIRDINFRAGT